MTMRHAVCSAFLGLFLASCVAVAQESPATAPAADPAIDPILDALDQSGKSLKSLSAEVSKADVDDIVGTSTIRKGRLWLEKKADGSYRVHVLLDTKQSGGKVEKEKSEYLLDDGKLTERNYHTKTEVTRQVLRPGQKMNLFKLGEGPFPLPLGQSKEDVHKEFEVTRQPSEKDDPAGTVRLRLTPKPGSDLARKFKQIEVAVDLKQNMPVRIDTVTPDDTHNTTNLGKVQMNQPMKDSDFKLESIDTGSWNVSSVPYEQ
jgi:outer membrane lipoprotein-sorting protein